MKRIEFIERVEEYDEEELDQAERAALPKPKPKVYYRRVYVKLAEIFAPKEIPNKKNHCLIEFYDGTTMIVKIAYDDACININDMENADVEEGED